MILKTFKEKLKRLEDSGEIDDNTEVCIFDNISKEVNIIDDNSDIFVDIDRCVENLEANAKFYEHSMPTTSMMMHEKALKLQSYGKKVLCLALNVV